MSRTTHHMCMNVRGILRWDKREFARISKAASNEDGSPVTPDEFREFLFDELAKGHEVIPMSEKPCDGFDFSGGGCPGHPIPDDEPTPASAPAPLP